MVSEAIVVFVLIIHPYSLPSFEFVRCLLFQHCIPLARFFSCVLLTVTFRNEANQQILHDELNGSQRPSYEKLRI